jgi:hypothetical protein
MPNEPAEPRSPTHRAAWWAGFAVGLLAAALTGWRWANKPPADDAPAPAPVAAARPDPRVAYQGPLQNVRPGVKYVGDAACAACHADIAETYKNSAMGRSLQPIAAVAAGQRYGPGTNNPFDFLGYRFLVEREADRVRHRQTRPGPGGAVAMDFALDVHYAIGSGARGRSYLTDRDGYLFQTPISWFAEKGVWDASPGFGADLLPGRPVREACVFCHTSQARPVQGYRNRYERPFAGHAVGCERCHGPGERHVDAGGTFVDGIDPTIVNPAKLEPALRESVCQQCHLEGEERVARRGRRPDEFRPGLPLDSVLSVFVHADDAGAKLVTHVEQMELSACYRGGGGKQKLGCVSCHDPHRKIGPDERVGFYRGRCLQCHDEHACRAAKPDRTARRDSCVDCHMPRAGVADIVHVASTDHRVIRPGKAGPRRPGRGDRLEPYLPRGDVARDRELARDLGIALVETAGADPAPLERGLALLDAAAADFPDDPEAEEARAVARLTLGRPHPARELLRKLLDRTPPHESVLFRHALACEAAGADDDALDSFRRAVEMNPWLALYRARLAAALAKRGAWAELAPQAEAWLRLDPGNLEAHKAHVTALVKTGHAAAARAAFDRARALHPFNQRELNAWFDELGR